MKPLVKRLKTKGFDIRIIDVAREPKKARQARIKSIPTFIHRYKGKETQRFSGTASAQRLQNTFRFSK